MCKLAKCWGEKRQFLAFNVLEEYTYLKLCILSRATPNSSKGTFSCIILFEMLHSSFLKQINMKVCNSIRLVIQMSVFR
jgi:hypothetical protein